MKHTTFILCISFILLSCNSTSSKSTIKEIQEIQRPNVNYKTYCNNRYNYCIDYPDFWQPQGESGSKDGQRFVSKNEKVRMNVFRSFKALSGKILTLEEAFSEEITKLNDLCNTSLNDKYYVIEGDLYNNLIFQKYTFLLNDEYFVVRIEYPKAEQKRFEKIIKHIIDSFKVRTENVEKKENFLSFLQTFLDKCWWNKNFNSLLHDNDKTLAQYIDTNMDVRRYYSPGAVPYLATREQNFGLSEYDDFTSIPTKEGTVIYKKMSSDNDPCNLENSQTVYYNKVNSVPEELINSETFEFVPVKIPYANATIMCVYLTIQESSAPLALYFIETPNGWKLAFVDDTLCSA